MTAAATAHAARIANGGTTLDPSPSAAAKASVSAPGGKYKTVVAEAVINNSDYTPTSVSLTIPGDQ